MVRSLYTSGIIKSGVSKGPGPRPSESWWWNDEVQRVNKAKRECYNYRKLPKAEEEREAFAEYKRGK